VNIARRGCVRPIMPPHQVRVPFRMHGAMGATAPTSADLRETGLIAAVKDQGSSGSCEGHSCSGATESAFALDGEPLGYIPSEAGLYTGARAIDRARFNPAPLALPPLTDDGAMTEDVLAHMATFGIRPRRIAETSDGRNSDVELAGVNDEPFLGDLEEGADRLTVGPYAIDPLAPDAEHQVQAAIAARIPVRVDAFVDMVFEDWVRGRAPVPTPNTNDPQGGGHAIYIVGYAPGFYIIRNSWGTSWGDGGDVRVSPAWLRAAWGLYPWKVRRVAA
jgi:hypothetical protein